MNQATVQPRKIVIVGGGAGGLELATFLGRKLGKKQKAHITLVDKHRVHIWKPLLHEVATGSLDTEIDGVVYRAHAKQHHYTFQLGNVTSLDRENKSITLDPVHDENQHVIVDQRKISYDILVMAVGSISNDFGTPGVAEHCHLLDSKAQAQLFQQHLQNEFLRKSTSTPREEIRVAIVGAGATGVELSAELNHMVDVVSVYDTDSHQDVGISIDLIEAGDHILPALPERISKLSAEQLAKIGVRIHTSMLINKATESSFVAADGTVIDADLLVWAAGVKGQGWLAETGLEVNRINQIVSHRTLKAVSDDSIFVLGDCCHLVLDNELKVPPRAQAAHQMASTVGKNIVNELAGKPLQEFRYRDYGSLVNLARFSTVGSLMGNLFRGSMFIEGRVARLMYLSLYRMHQMAVHGFLKGPFIILLSSVSKIIRPKIKLH